MIVTVLGTWEAGYNLPCSSPSDFNPIFGAFSLRGAEARTVLALDTVTMIAGFTGSIGPMSGAYEIHHFRGVGGALSHRP